MPLFSIVNLIIFQTAWFSAALLKDDSVVILVLLLALHAFLSTKKQADLCALISLLPIAIVSEFLMITTSLLSYQSEYILPVWIMLLWGHLCLSINHSLEWLKKVPLVWQSLLAALAGTGSYAAATSFGVIKLHNDQVISLLIIAVIWAVQFPLMLKVSRHVKQGSSICPIYK